MLIRYTDKSREVVPPQEDFDSSIFDVDEEMRAIGLGEHGIHDKLINLIGKKKTIIDEEQIQHWLYLMARHLSNTVLR